MESAAGLFELVEEAGRRVSTKCCQVPTLVFFPINLAKLLALRFYHLFYSNYIECQNCPNLVLNLYLEKGSLLGNGFSVLIYVRSSVKT